MLTAVVAATPDEQALAQTLDDLRRAGLAQVRVLGPAGNTQGPAATRDGAGAGLDAAFAQVLEALADGWVLLVWAGERLVGELGLPTDNDACWLPVAERGARRLELRLARNQPGLYLSAGMRPALSLPTCAAPWSGGCPGTLCIVRDHLIAAGDAPPPTGDAQPADLLAAAASYHARRQFRRAAALAAAAGHRLDPASYLAWEAAMAEARAWQGAGAHARAAGPLQRAALHHPQATETHFQLGCCLGRLGRWPEAAAALQTCLDQGAGPWYYSPSPDVAGWRARWALAAAREATGNLPAAAELYAAVFRVQPEQVEALYRLAGCLSRMGKPQLIAATVGPLLDAADPAHGLLLADILAVGGRFAQAQQTVAAVERLAGATLDTCFLRGFTLFMCRRFAAARVAFERIAPSCELYGQALLWRLHTAWAEDDWPEATLVLRKLKQAPVAPALRRLYQHLHRLLVDGGWFAPLGCPKSESAAMGGALLTALHAFWTVGQVQLAGRLLLLLPLLKWPQRYRDAGLLALRCALGPTGQQQGRRLTVAQRQVLGQAGELLSRVEPPDPDVVLARAQVELLLGRPQVAHASLLRGAPEQWQAFVIWARALTALGARLDRRPRRRRQQPAGTGASKRRPSANRAHAPSASVVGAAGGLRSIVGGQARMRFRQRRRLDFRFCQRRQPDFDLL